MNLMLTTGEREVLRIAAGHSVIGDSSSDGAVVELSSVDADQLLNFLVTGHDSIESRWHDAHTLRLKLLQGKLMALFSEPRALETISH